MKTVPFGQCTQSNLTDLFGLRQIFKSQQLDRWLETEVALSEDENIVLRGAAAVAPGAFSEGR